MYGVWAVRKPTSLDFGLFCEKFMAQPRVLILRAPAPTATWKRNSPSRKPAHSVDRLHIQRLRDNPKLLLQYQIMTIPGGFTYGDDVAAGKILAVQLQHFLGDVLREFRDKERLILGICNGFQCLLKAGLIVPPDLDDGPVATLAHNSHGKFEDRWIHLQATPGKCPFLKGYQRLHLPIAHGEGNFICSKEWILKGLIQAGQVVLRMLIRTANPEVSRSIRTARKATSPAFVIRRGACWA